MARDGGACAATSCLDDSNCDDARTPRVVLQGDGDVVR